MESCQTCYFFAPTDEAAKIGFCHRQPPQLSPDDDDPLQGHWPAVSESDWCGEYQQVKSPVAAPAPAG